MILLNNQVEHIVYINQEKKASRGLFGEHLENISTQNGNDTLTN